MAAEEKTEKATPKKKKDERKKGNIPQSKDIVVALSVLLMFYTLKVCLPFIYEYLSTMFERYFVLMGNTAVVSETFALDLFRDLCLTFVITVGPLMLMSIAVGVVATGVQTKFKFAGEKLKPKFSTMNPLKGIQNLVSMRSLVELVKSIIKIVIIGYVLVGEYQSLAQHFATLFSVGIMQGALFILDSIMNIVLKLSIIFIAIAAFDYMYQRWDHEKKLRMTKQEIKEEWKQAEGDPQVKGKIKEKQRAMSMQRMMQQVPGADVIVRNPTHFAVALKYDIEKYAAPVVVAKGQDRVALKIIEVGEQNHVPMREDKPLARALYAAVEVNHEIPPEFYNAIADVMAWVYTMKQKEAKPVEDTE